MEGAAPVVVDDASEARGRTAAEDADVAGLAAVVPDPVEVLLATEDGRPAAAPVVEDEEFVVLPTVEVRGAAGRTPGRPAVVVVGRVGVEAVVVVVLPAGRVGLTVPVVDVVDPTGRLATPAVAVVVEVRGPVAGVAAVRPAARRAEGPVAVVVFGCK